MTSKWPLVPLGEIAEVIAGQSPEGRHYNSEGVGLPFYQGKKDFSDRWIAPASTWTRKSIKIAERGDILMSVRAPVGPINLATEKCCIGRGLAAIRPTDRVSMEFLFYYLQSIQEQISGSEGAVFASINKSQIAALSIPLPPLDEQKRIVDRLDQIFAGIDSAEQVVKSEISALQSFAAGLLTDLLSHTGDVRVFTLAELMKDGLVHDHMDGNHGGNYPRKSEFIDSGVPYISARAIVDGQVEFSAAKYLSPKRAALLRKGLAKNGDVLFAHNATVGPVAVLRTEEPLVILGTSLTYYRCDSSRLSPDFLAHYMRSLAFVRQYQNVMGQSTRNQVPITTQRRFTFSIPSLPIQVRIAEIMNAALVESSQLLTSFESKLTLFRGLGSSVLTEALRERL